MADDNRLIADVDARDVLDNGPETSKLDAFFDAADDEPTDGGVATPGRDSTPEPIVERRSAAQRPTWRDRRKAGRLHARKVRRLVRHVEPWSVLKIGLVFYFCLWCVMLVASVLLWSAAVSSGTIDNIEDFIQELFALDTFEFDADQIFRAYALGGLVMVVAATGFTVLLAVLFNLISDLMGGVRITVVEEETARPRPRVVAAPTAGSPGGLDPPASGDAAGAVGQRSALDAGGRRLAASRRGG